MTTLQPPGQPEVVPAGSAGAPQAPSMLREMHSPPQSANGWQRGSAHGAELATLLSLPGPAELRRFNRPWTHPHCSRCSDGGQSWEPAAATDELLALSCRLIALGPKDKPNASSRRAWNWLVAAGDQARRQALEVSGRR